MIFHNFYKFLSLIKRTYLKISISSLQHNDYSKKIEISIIYTKKTALQSTIDMIRDPKYS